MPIDTQQFIEKARQQGISDEAINSFLQSKGESAPSQSIFGSREVSGGLLGFVAPALATLPQAIGLNVGARQTAKLSEGFALTLEQQADIAQSLLRDIQSEKDPKRKEQLRVRLRDVQKNVNEQNKTFQEISSGKGLSQSTRIHIPGLITSPGLEPGLGGATQIAGRSIRQIGSAASPALGATGAGALYGLGTGLERGSSPVGVAAESAATAVGFKAFNFGFGKLANTKAAQNIFASPVGSATLKVGNAVFSPFLAKPAAEGAVGALVDQQFKNFGTAIDKLYSPSTYLKPVKEGFTKVGQATGLTKTPEQKLIASKEKVTNYWNNTKNRYQSLVKYDKNSPEVLGREGVIPEGKNGAFMTREQAQIVKNKAIAEHSLLNRVLDESGIYVSTEEYRRQAINAIAQNFKGVERQAALRAFNNQFDALLKDNAGQIVVDGRIPIRVLNDMKTYMWSQGYPGKLAQKPERLIARAMRISGNTAKTYIDTMAGQESKELAEAILELNKHSGELFQAEKFLLAMNGKKLPFGLIGRHFARVIGTIVGSQGGVIGSVAGTMTADQVVNVLQNPNITVGKASILIGQLRQQNPVAVERALRILKKMAEIRAITPKLPPSTTIFSR